MIRVLIADDHSVVRDGLRAILSREWGLEVVGEASSGREAIAAFVELRPDVTVMDLRLPDMEGYQAVTAIRFRDPGAAILMFSTFEAETDVVRCVQAGARGYLVKGASRQELVDALRRIAQGQLCFSRNISNQLAEGLAASPLTGREMEVLQGLGEGMSNEDIAAGLEIAVPTVKGHLTHLMTKLGVRNRTQALAAAIRRGILPGSRN